jgi:hypothetical protein
MFFMTVTMIVLWSCAFFTDIVGVNAIFGKWFISFHWSLAKVLLMGSGAFLAGIIVPREGGLAISLTEKLEDMTTIIFLPLVRVLNLLSDKAHYFTVLHALRVKYQPRIA